REGSNRDRLFNQFPWNRPVFEPAHGPPSDRQIQELLVGNRRGDGEVAPVWSQCSVRNTVAAWTPCSEVLLPKPVHQWVLSRNLEILIQHVRGPPQFIVLLEPFHG